MRTSVRRMLCATAIAGGFTVLGIAFATTASAADAPSATSGANGLVSGNQTGGDATAPVDASDNQVTVIGDGQRASRESADARGGRRTGETRRANLVHAILNDRGDTQVG